MKYLLLFIKASLALKIGMYHGDYYHPDSVNTDVLRPTLWDVLLFNSNHTVVWKAFKNLGGSFGDQIQKTFYGIFDH